jgi:RNA polymerase sigma-70 factor (ECF subfamily)
MNSSLFQEQIIPIQNKLFRFALRITGSHQDAEDVVQEVLSKVWQSSEEQSTQVQNWEAWCMTLTRNRSLDKSRAVALRRTDTLEVVSVRINDGYSPEQAAENKDLVDQVRRFMQQLPEKQRLVMHLRDVEELSYDEIALTLDMSLDMVKVNLHRARKTVREKMLSL